MGESMKDDPPTVAGYFAEESKKMKEGSVGDDYAYCQHPEWGTPVFDKAVGRMKRVCKKCRVTELV